MRSAIYCIGVVHVGAAGQLEWQDMGSARRKRVRESVDVGILLKRVLSQNCTA